MQNNQKWNPTGWTITQGTSGNCKFTISAAATGSGGVASKTVSLSKTVTCSNCPSGSGGGSSGSGGGAGSGGGGAGIVIAIVVLDKPVQQELGIGQSLQFSFGSVNHSLTVLNLTETTAKIRIASKVQTFDITVGDELRVNLDDDEREEFVLKLKSINIITKKALFILTPLYIPAQTEKSAEGTESSAPAADNEEKKDKETPGLIELKGSSKWLWIIGIAIVLGIGVVAGYVGWIKHQKRRLQRAVVLKHFKSSA